MGTTIIMTVQNTDKSTRVGLFLSYMLVTSVWVVQVLNVSMITRNIAGQTKKSVVVAAHFISWAAGNAGGQFCPFSLFFVEADVLNAGPQVFLSWNKPRYFIAFSVHMGCYIVMIFTIAFLRFYLARQNAVKDRLRAELRDAGTLGVIDEKMVHAFDDLTDKENMNFRYVY